MTTEAKQPRKEKNSDFGLPQAEFRPIAEGGSRWLKITAIIVGIVLVIGAGIVYWFFHQPPATPSEETHLMHKEYESKVLRADVDSIDDDASATHQTLVEAKQGQTHEFDKELEALEEEKKALSTHLTAQPRKGTIKKVNTPLGYYHVVVGSFIDDDLALDYASRLAKHGVDVMLIAPAPGKYFYYVAVDQAGTFYDASKKVEAFKATYGKDIWVMKY